MNYSKDLYEYLLKVQESEKNRIKNIEEKAKYIFSINSLLLVGVFFKFRELSDNFPAFPALLRIIDILLLLFSLVFLMTSFFSTLNVIKTRNLKGIYPDNLVDTLFNPESGFIPSDDPDSFYTAMAKHLAIAIEFNRKIIHLKNRQVRLSWLFVVLGFLGISIFISTMLIYG